MKARYVSPFTDFGFKKLFGEEASKPVLIDFLNSLLPESHIVDLTFKDKEKLGHIEEDRKSVYDIYCQNDKGEKIIVELQKAKQNFFKDRTIYYSTFPIQEQAEKGFWNYELKSVYCVGILDFTFEDKLKAGAQGEVLHTVQLKDQNNQLFYNKLKFVYLEMPHFHKSEHELGTRLDQWLYFIKHLEDFQSIPLIFQDAVFIQAFEKAEIAKYTPEELDDYQQSLKIYRDLNNVIDTAYGDGIKTIAKKLKEKGMDMEFILEATGLAKEEIEGL
jgi:predicted transposase/invertase (TIGR01784 family)